MYYSQIAGMITNIATRFKFTRLLPKVVKIYEISPTLADCKEKNYGLSRKELAHLSVPAMSIAGTVGPKPLLNNCMGGCTNLSLSKD